MSLLGGFMQQVGLNVGRDMIVGQDLAQQKADTDYKQALTAQQRMATMTMQREQEDAKQIGSYIKSEQDKDASTITDPVKSAKLYQQGEGIALQNGDFKGAALMADMAKGKLNEAVEQAKVVAQQQQVKKEALSTAATDYAANPTPETAKSVAEAAVAAGVDPTKIPAPGTPAFKAWANNQQTASMSGKERVEFAEKTAENQARIAETRQNHQDSLAIRQEEMRSRAAMQQANFALRREMMLDRQSNREMKAPEVKDIGGKPYEYDPTGQVKGDRNPQDPRWVQIAPQKLTAQQNSGIARAFASGAEISRGLTAMDKLPQGTAVSPFSQLHATSATDALLKVGTNQLTPAQVQMMGVSSKGLGVEFGNLLAAMGGRSPNQSVMNELQEMSTPSQGDTGYTALYKRANAADIVRTYINNLPGDAPNDPRAKKILAELDTLGKPEDVLKRAEKAGYSKNLSAIDAKADEARRKAAEAAQESGSAAPAASAPALPEGWSVKVH